MTKYYLTGFFAALLLQWSLSFVMVKLNLRGQSDLAMYISFIAMTTYKSNIIFLNPPIFSFAWVAFHYSWDNIFDLKSILVLFGFLVFVYFSCWAVFMLAIHAAGAR